MAKSGFSAFPPYEGDEPYLYLCFDEADAGRVRPLLAALYKRGCRVWYSMGKAADAKRIERRSARIRHASLLLLYLTPDAANDEAMKSMLGYYQEFGGPVISVEAAPSSELGGLSYVLAERAQRVRAYDLPDTETLLAAILRTDGFSQTLMGEPGNENPYRLRRVALTLFALALAVLAATFFYGRSSGWFSAEPPMPADTVTISDEVIRQAARDAISPYGNAALTQESLDGVATLRLNGVPASYDALALFPALTRLEIPQAAVSGASALLDGAEYTIVVYGEAGE